jgi:8-oxo-dGTP pyrophosphatase MutT (NUDIX family)
MTVGHRLTSRILLFDETGSILLFLTTAPDTSGFARWVTPGGGVDPGETHADAAIRELFEETGLAIEDPGPAVWHYDFVVQWDNADHDTGHAEFYVVRTTRFAPSSAGWTDDEKIDTLDWRWWSLKELRTTSEPFEPMELLAIIDENRSKKEEPK